MPDPWVARFRQVLEISVGASLGNSCLSPRLLCVKQRERDTAVQCLRGSLAQTVASSNWRLKERGCSDHVQGEPKALSLLFMFEGPHTACQQLRAFQGHEQSRVAKEWPKLSWGSSFDSWFSPPSTEAKDNALERTQAHLLNAASPAYLVFCISLCRSVAGTRCSERPLEPGEPVL